MLPESIDELDSTVGGPIDVGEPLEKDRSRFVKSRLMVGCESPITWRSRVGGDAGGVSLNEGEPESMLVLEDDPLLRALEASRLHDPLRFVMDPLIMTNASFVFCLNCS